MLHDFKIKYYIFCLLQHLLLKQQQLNIPNGSITDFNKDNPDFNNGAKNFKNLSFCILVNCAFDNLISVDVWLAKALQILATCLLVNNNL